MPLIFAAITPHGDQILLELEPDKVADSTRQAMIKLGARLESLSPDTVVILTPHGIRVENMISVSVSERADGRLNKTVQMAFEVDQPLACQIADAGEATGITMARTIYGASSGEGCRLPLDWGAIIPLWFLGAHYANKPRIVVMCPSRQLTYRQLFDFGKALAEVCDHSNQRIALIASADQAHAHSADGPYGFSPTAATYDTIMREAVQSNTLESLIDIDPELVGTALPDSLWQTLILAGALQSHPMSAELLSYEVSEYFGMLCAQYINNVS